MRLFFKRAAIGFAATWVVLLVGDRQEVGMKILAALLVLIAEMAGAETLAVGWAAATGPVASYVVEVTEDGGPWTEQETVPAATLQSTPRDYADGSVLQFRVYGRDAQGRAGPRSPLSAPVVVGEDRGPVVITAPGVPVVIMP